MPTPVGPTIITPWWFSTQGEFTSDVNAVLSSPRVLVKSTSSTTRRTAQLGGLQDSFESAVLTLQQFRVDQQSEAVFETETRVVGVLSLLEQSRRPWPAAAGT